MPALPNRPLGRSDLEVFPLALGGNVFGWTADQRTSFEVLDAYVGQGGNFIDTADSYSFWAPGNQGGESETILGAWFASRRNRDQVVLASKVSQHPDFKGIAPETIRAGVDSSLRRLGTDHIDLYYAHFDDPERPLHDTVAAFSALVEAGKIRAIGISNFSPARIAEWLEITAQEGFHRPVALQPEYSLVERGIESTLMPLADRAGIGLVTYYSLARGFLTGKYRQGAEDATSPRAAAASAYLDERGRRVLDALDEVAAAHGVAPATVALAWVAAQPGITAPIASARNLGQLPDLMAHATVTLTGDELSRLDEASRPGA